MTVAEFKELLEDLNDDDEITVQFTNPDGEDHYLDIEDVGSRDDPIFSEVRFYAITLDLS